MKRYAVLFTLFCKRSQCGISWRWALCTTEPWVWTQQIVCYLVMSPLHVYFVIYKVGIIKSTSVIWRIQWKIYLFSIWHDIDVYKYLIINSEIIYQLVDPYFLCSACFIFYTTIWSYDLIIRDDRKFMRVWQEKIQSLSGSFQDCNDGSKKLMGQLWSLFLHFPWAKNRLQRKWREKTKNKRSKRGRK